MTLPGLAPAPSLGCLPLLGLLPEGRPSALGGGVRQILARVCTVDSVPRGPPWMAELPILSRQPLGPVLGLDKAACVPVFWSLTRSHAQCIQLSGIRGMCLAAR